MICRQPFHIRSEMKRQKISIMTNTPMTVPCCITISVIIPFFHIQMERNGEKRLKEFRFELTYSPRECCVLLMLE